MGKNLISYRLIYKETDALIKAESEDAIWAARRAIIDNRNELERYIFRDPWFKYSFEPVEVEHLAPEIVRRMAEAAKVARVGPMAAVAGALAQVGVEGAVKAGGARNAIVENGGDIYMHGDESYRVAIHAGGSPLSNKLALEIEPSMMPVSVCTSSGSVGPSISFGNADAVTVIAKSGALADAAATSVCNETRGEPKQAIIRALERAKNIHGVISVLIIYGNYVGHWGVLPEVIFTDRVSEELAKRLSIE
jgi:ApbE superfamily uncharacterized protein (UPF0280 family)